MKQTIRLILFLCILSLSRPISHTLADPKPSTQDLFNLLNETSPTTSSERSVMQEIRDNAEIKLLTHSLFYLQAPDTREDMDDDRVVVESMLRFKTHVTRGTHQFGLSGWVEYGTQDETYSQKDYYFGVEPANPDIERHRRYAELNELYWLASWGNVDVTLGKKQFAIGLAALYSPADRLEPFDLNDPLRIKRYGLWQLAVNTYNGPTTFTAALFPFFIPPKIPTSRSRWLIAGDSEGSIKDFQFLLTDIDPVTGIDTDLPQGIDELQGLLRVKTTISGWDAFLALFTGVPPYPALRAGDPNSGESAVVREYIRATTVSFGFSTTVGRFELHGEGLLQWSHSAKDDDYLTTIAGMTYSFGDLVQSIGLDELKFSVDYAREALIARQDNDRFIESSEQVRVGQDDILMLLSVHFDIDAIFELFMNINLDDDGRIFSPEFQYRLWEGFWLKIRSDFLIGKGNSFYGRWEKNDRLIISFEYTFNP